MMYHLHIKNHGEGQDHDDNVEAEGVWEAALLFYRRLPRPNDWSVESIKKHIRPLEDL